MIPPQQMISELTYCCREIARTWRKVDLRIMPIAVILYLASYIDRYVGTFCYATWCTDLCLRANIGNARVLGMATELKLTSGQYNWALSIFFIGW
jgi:hypothetical protein